MDYVISIIVIVGILYLAYAIYKRYVELRIMHDDADAAPYKVEESATVPIVAETVPTGELPRGALPNIEDVVAAKPDLKLVKGNVPSKPRKPRVTKPAPKIVANSVEAAPARKPRKSKTPPAV